MFISLMPPAYTRPRCEAAERCAAREDDRIAFSRARSLNLTK